MATNAIETAPPSMRQVRSLPSKLASRECCPVPPVPSANLVSSCNRRPRSPGCVLSGCELLDYLPRGELDLGAAQIRGRASTHSHLFLIDLAKQQCWPDNRRACDLTRNRVLREFTAKVAWYLAPCSHCGDSWKFESGEMMDQRLFLSSSVRRSGVSRSRLSLDVHSHVALSRANTTAACLSSKQKRHSCHSLARALYMQCTCSELFANLPPLSLRDTSIKTVIPFNASDQRQSISIITS